MGEPSHLQQETSSPEHRQPDGGEEDMDEEEDMDDDEPMQDHDGQAIAAAADPDNANAAGREDDEAEEIWGNGGWGTDGRTENLRSRQNDQLINSNKSELYFLCLTEVIIF